MQELTSEQILDADDLKREAVEVEEWGGTVWIREMNAIERDHFEQGLAAGLREGQSREEAMSNYRARLVVLVACNKAGDRLFKDDQAGTLGKKNAAAIEKLYNVAERLNLLSDEGIVDESKKSDPSTAVASISG